jgi:hypothetical protein
LHWIPLSREALNNSVWKASKKSSAVAAQPSHEFSVKLTAIFKKKSTASPIKGKPVIATRCSAPKNAGLVDLSRCNNIAISLRAFKELSLDELRDIIADTEA